MYSTAINKTNYNGIVADTWPIPWNEIIALEILIGKFIVE